MARCNCSGSTCSCKLQEGNGIAISGSGSTTDPYVIDATGDIEGTVQFISTPTVEFSVSGQGTSASPFQVHANAVVNMDELADVHDPTGPLEGEVPVWTTDHWEFKTPASAPPGTVNVGQGLSGDGSAGAPLKASVSGIWGQGTMPAPPWPTDSTVGMPIYTDSNGQLRTRPKPLTRGDQPGMTIVNPISGWRVDYANFERYGPLVYVQAQLTRTSTSAIAGSASGNIANTQIATLGASMPLPNARSRGVFGMGEQGNNNGFNMTADGKIYLVWMPPNYTLSQNGVVSFNGIYMTEAGADVLLPVNTMSA